MGAILWTALGFAGAAAWMRHANAGCQVEGEDGAAVEKLTLRELFSLDDAEAAAAAAAEELEG